MGQKMNVTQYAKHRGCSRQAVYDALRDGRIEKEPDGKIDPTKADRMWAELTDPGRGGHQQPERPDPEQVGGDTLTAPPQLGPVRQRQEGAATVGETLLQWEHGT